MTSSEQVFYGEEVERVHVGRMYPHVEQVWRNGDPWASTTLEIVLGRLPDGRWYVSAHDRWHNPPAAAYAGPHAEHYARGTARRWRRTFGGEWVEA